MQGAEWCAIHNSLFGKPCGFACFLIQYGSEAIQTVLLLMCGDKDRLKILNRGQLTHPYQHSRATCGHEQKLVLGHG
jgi:hypothetical protein